jgi:hypothetical protein
MGASSQNYGGGNMGGGKSTGGGYQGNYNQGNGYGNNQTFGNSFGNDYRSNRFGGGPLNGSPMDQPIPLPGRGYGGGRYNQPQMNQPQMGMGKSQGPGYGGGFNPQQQYNNYQNQIFGNGGRGQGRFAPNFNQPQQQAMNSQTAFMQNQITPGQMAPTMPTPQPGLTAPMPFEPVGGYPGYNPPPPQNPMPFNPPSPGLTPDPIGGKGAPPQGYDPTGKTIEQRRQDYLNANNQGINMVMLPLEQFGLTEEDLYGAPAAPAAPAAPIPQAVFTPQAPQYQQAQTAYKPPVSTNTARMNTQQQQMAATRARIPK